MTNESASRRDFLQALLRGAIAGALTLGVGALVFRKREEEAPVTQQSCISDGYCRTCRILQSCQLPRGISTREALQGEAGGQ